MAPVFQSLTYVGLDSFFSRPVLDVQVHLCLVFASSSSCHTAPPEPLVFGLAPRLSSLDRHLQPRVTADSPNILRHKK